MKCYHNFNALRDQRIRQRTIGGAGEEKAWEVTCSTHERVGDQLATEELETSVATEGMETSVATERK